MNVLYVYAHPSAASFNHMLKKSGVGYLKTLNHDVLVSDLYADNFHAVASWDDFNLSDDEINNQYFLSQQTAYQKHALADEIDAEIKKLAWANHIVFQFPLWWFSMPAMMKGWFDRVLVKGFAYDAGKVFADGLLAGKTASLVMTTQSPESAYQVDGVHGDTIDVFLRPIHHTLRFVGIQPVPPFVAYNAFNVDEIRRNELVKEYHHYLQHSIAIK